MKKQELLICLLIIIVSLMGCNSVPSNVVASKATLAWGDKKEWTDILTAAVSKSVIDPHVKSPCKNVGTDICLILTIAKMAQYESSFNPSESYKEGFADAKGNAVISRGLLQISQESANQKAYGCGIVKAEDLHKVDVNLQCAVKIAVYWLNKDKVFFGGEKLGLGRYWSVGRASSKSNAKILAYLKEY